MLRMVSRENVNYFGVAGTEGRSPNTIISVYGRCRQREGCPPLVRVCHVGAALRCLGLAAHELTVAKGAGAARPSHRWSAFGGRMLMS
ncbi:hypothetical protein Dimus_024992, partial [Dionaea muscipula]